MQDAPQPLKTAAILQIVSGVVNFFIMPTLVYFFVGGFCAIATFIIGGLGGLCGTVGCLLVPVGLFEIVSGILALTNPKGSAGLMKICAYVEMGSVLLGGIPAAIVGFLVMNALGNDEVKAYLEG